MVVDVDRSIGALSLGKRRRDLTGSVLVRAINENDQISVDNRVEVRFRERARGVQKLQVLRKLEISGANSGWLDAGRPAELGQPNSGADGVGINPGVGHNNWTFAVSDQRPHVVGNLVDVGQRLMNDVQSASCPAAGWVSLDDSSSSISASRRDTCSACSIDRSRMN